MSPPINSHQPIPRPHPDQPTTYRIDALAAADATGILASPASIFVHVESSSQASPAIQGRLTVRVMSRRQADSEPTAPIRIDRPQALLLPALFNAHAHLDLTSVGPLESARGNFPKFINHVRAHRPADDSTIRSSVAQGIALSLAGGVAAIGDIAGAPRGLPSLTPLDVLASSPLTGVSFVEFFGIGSGETVGWERLLACINAADPTGTPTGTPKARLGLQPHAPYSTSNRLFSKSRDLAIARGLPICTHLAESPAEHEFIAHARGPQRDLLESLGLWTPDLLADIGHGKTPIEHLAHWLSQETIAVHLNDVSDADLAILTQRSPKIVYCPRSSAYFDAPAHFGPHRYREMLARGLTVALGTDSILNLPAHAATESSGGISTLDEMRLLFRRDATNPLTLLAMATTHGATALQLPQSHALLTSGSPVGLIAVPTGSVTGNPLEAALRSDDPPELLFLSN